MIINDDNWFHYKRLHQPYVVL